MNNNMPDGKRHLLMLKRPKLVTYLTTFLSLVVIIGVSVIVTHKASALTIGDNVPGRRYDRCDWDSLKPVPDTVVSSGQNNWVSGGFKYVIYQLTFQTQAAATCEVNITQNPQTFQGQPDNNNIHIAGSGGLIDLHNRFPNNVQITGGNLTNVSDLFRDGSYLENHYGAQDGNGNAVFYKMNIGTTKANQVWLGVPCGTKGSTNLGNPQGCAWMTAAAAGCGSSITPYSGPSTPPTFKGTDSNPTFNVNFNDWPVYLHHDCRAAVEVNDAGILSLNNLPIWCQGGGAGTLSDFGIDGTPYRRICGAFTTPYKSSNATGGYVGDSTPGIGQRGNAGNLFIYANCRAGWTDRHTRYPNYVNPMGCTANDHYWYSNYYLGQQSGSCNSTNLSCLLGTTGGALNSPTRIRARLKSTIDDGYQTTYLTFRYPIATTSFDLTPQATITTNDVNNENPTTATFSPVIHKNVSQQINSIATVRNFYVDKFRGANIPIMAPRNATVNLPANGDYVFTPDTQNLPAGLVAGDRICGSISVNPGSGRVDPVTHRWSSPGASKIDTDCVTIKDVPYLKFYGNDVFVGGGFTGTSCNTVGSIFTNNRVTSHRGSSAQFAAQVLGTINGFTSANVGGLASPQPANGLTFANTPLPVGNFGGTHCVKDYWNDRPGTFINPSPHTPPNPPCFDFAQTTTSPFFPSGAYFWDTTSLPKNYIGFGESFGNNCRHKAYNSPNFQSGKKYFIYVDGNVRINENIIFSDNWTKQSDIPALYVISNGNIYIDHAVHRLDGVYIAMQDPLKPPNPNKGNIYTCSAPDGPFDIVTAADQYTHGTCNSDLVVNGTFIANKIFFLRTQNSLRNSSPNEKASTSNAAEIFQFTPETYLADFCSVPSLATLCPSTKQYDSITSLPPVL